jgi:hypothetical protein
MTRTQATVWGWLGRWAVPLGALAAGLVLLFTGVVALGRYTRDHVRDWDRYQTPFADVRCPAPPAQSAADFLAEVQYLSNLPDRLNVLDDQLGPRLAAAFARHPWVEEVERVEIAAPRRVQVRLVFRVPVLAVPGEGPARAVDRHGVLLPPAADVTGLPVYRGHLQVPAAATGEVWGDPGVLAAARTAGFLSELQDQLQLTWLEVGKDGVTLGGPGDTRVVWGRPPDGEPGGEASPADKRERLRSYCARHGGLDQPDGPYEHDVRPVGRALRRHIKN